MPFRFLSGWHSVITAKQSFIFKKSDMTIAEEVSHSANTASIGVVHLMAPTHAISASTVPMPI